MQDQAQATQQRSNHRVIRHLMAALSVEALGCVPPAKVAETARDWLGRRISYPAEHADAVRLASDLAVFAPSASGMTAIDRLARQRKPASPAEATAMDALRGAKLRLVRIEKRESRSVLHLIDLASGETLPVADEHIPNGAIGLSVLVRTAAVADGAWLLVGPITPLEKQPLDVAMGFVGGGGQGLTNPHRCAEAVYRCVLKHGVPEIPGLTGRPVDPRKDSELDVIAHRWAKLQAGATPPAASVQRVRRFTSTDDVLDVLAASILAREQTLDRLADAYAAIAAIQIETLSLREANGMSGASLSMLSSAIAHAIGKYGLPASARTLFEDLRRRHRAAPATGAENTDLERLVQRIQGLRAKTVERGCTEHEALAAAEKVAELLDRYGLSLSSIELQHQACQGVGIDTGRRRVAPIDDCVTAIAAFFDCRVWSEKSEIAAIRHVFFGLRADVAAAHYLYDLVEITFTTETATFVRGAFYTKLESGERRSASNSFQVGLARGIAGKLRALRVGREAAFQSSGQALVPIKTAIIDEELAKLGMSFRSRSRSSPRYLMDDAYQAGQAAGERFDVQPGLAAAD